ncbi:hypothetical protein PMIN04_010178 [Paraphaeosphaeria minitans]
MSSHSRILLMVAPAFWLFGCNQSNLGGVVGYRDFTNLKLLPGARHRTHRRAQ